MTGARCWLLAADGITWLATWLSCMVLSLVSRLPACVRHKDLSVLGAVNFSSRTHNTPRFSRVCDLTRESIGLAAVCQLVVRYAGWSALLGGRSGRITCRVCATPCSTLPHLLASVCRCKSRAGQAGRVFMPLLERATAPCGRTCHLLSSVDVMNDARSSK